MTDPLTPYGNRPMVTPIVNAVNYEYRDFEVLRKITDGEIDGYTYHRDDNPTVRAVEKRSPPWNTPRTACRSGPCPAAMKGTARESGNPATAQALQARLHAHCVLCGARNPKGLRLAFRVLADGRVEADFPCDRLYQGYTGYLHGGVIAALLDSAMTNCLFAHGRAALTGELNVRYRKPVLVSRPVSVRARLVKARGPLFFMEADVGQDGRRKATATATFVEAAETDVPLADGRAAPGTDIGRRRPG